MDPDMFKFDLFEFYCDTHTFQVTFWNEFKEHFKYYPNKSIFSMLVATNDTVSVTKLITLYSQ